MTLNNLEGKNIKGDSKENGVRKSKNVYTNNILVYNLGTGIRLTTTITGKTYQSILKHHRQQSYGMNGN